MHPRRRIGAIRRIAVPAIAVLALALWASAAQGWYALGGAGTGTAPAGALRDLTATAAPTSAALVPGGSVDVALELSNPNPVAVRVESIALDADRGDGGFTADRADCTAPALAFARQANDGAGWLVPARSGGADGRLAILLPDALAMGETAQGACQGAIFAVHLRVG